MSVRNRMIQVALVALLASMISCSGGNKDAPAVRKDPIYGFYLGEKSSDLFERVRYRTSWEKTEDPKADYRGEMYIFSRPVDGSREVSRLRLSFVDGFLMEIVAYMKSTNVSRLNLLKNRLEEEYGVKPTSPDGTIEMAYKTYWFKVPGMSVTLRRITKSPETELYIQYMHNDFQQRIE